ncbi:hypothetical protein PYCC9005_001809 [Savitreella phatthalungensis]
MPLFSSPAFPAFSTLAASVALAWGIQAAVAVPSIALQTEKVYDLSGSVTFLACTAASLYYPTFRLRQQASAQGLPLPAWPSLSKLPAQKLVVSAMVTIWACRLGSFLFDRIMKHGRDSRFDEIKKSPVQFSGAFAAQATWVTCVAAPIFAVNALPNAALTALPGPRILGLRPIELLGAATWVAGFAFEVTADRQKSAWRKAKDAKEHDEKFISSGLWSISRHPNYFGESLLWTGTAILASSTLTAVPKAFPLSNAALVGISFLSPLFVTMLTRFVSGVPLLEKKAAEKYGKEWEQYERETPVFFPKFF